jgi:hypothetical protein
LDINAHILLKIGVRIHDAINLDFLPFKTLYSFVQSRIPPLAEYNLATILTDATILCETDAVYKLLLEFMVDCSSAEVYDQE